MIELYSKGTTDFTKHGIALAAKEASVTYQDNGRFDMDMTMPYNALISIDYGMILRCPVPKQTIGAITLGTVEYWEIASGETDVKLYSEVPTLRTLSYKPWSSRGSYMGLYNVGEKVTYNNRNYQVNSTYNPLLDPEKTQVPPPNSWYDEIPRTTGKPGKVAATLTAGDTIVKTGDFNSTYMKAADTAGHEGFIQISKCVDMSQTETIVIPAQTIENQSFTITEIEKSTDGKTIRLHAEHISYQLQRTVLADCNISRATPATALMFIRGAMKEDYPGEIYTNLTEETITGNYSWKNAQNALLDPKAGLLAQANAIMIRNDLNVFILAEETPDPRYRITYGINMKAVNWEGSVSDIVTRVYPIAQTEDGTTLLLPEEYIDTVRTVPYIRPEVLDTKLKIGTKEKQEDGTEIELTEDIVYSRMREAANNRFTIDECDKPVITLDVDWEHLPDTEEYSAYKALQNAGPGEWVLVENGPLGINEQIRMTGYTYDPILLKYKKGTFGKKKAGGTVASYELKSGSVTARAIGAGSVGSGAIQAETITAREIEANAITADRIASRSLTTELIMANAITANEINANAVTADKISAGSVTADKIDAGAVTAVKIAANAINADKIDANDITAIVAKLGAAHITNGVIDNAQIGYAAIVDANIQSLIARDAVTDKYFIDKLAVRNAQIVQATVGELVIKASDNKYYRLDVAADGSVSPTEVTLTAAEIDAGETSNGHGAIIETDLTVADLSASNMKGINALIDKLTASRIDVDELWARQAFVSKLMVQDISSNTYIQSTIGNWTSSSTITQSINSLDSRISSLGYGTVYMQPEEPSHSELVPGDIWIQTQPSGTWTEVYSDYSTWQDIYNNVSTWQTLGGVSIMWVWDGRKWQKQLDNLDSDTFETEIAQNAQNIQLLANRMTSAEGNITTLSASLVVANNAITAEVTRATNAEGGKLDKTTSYQTADSIVTEAVRQAGVNAGNSYIAKTTIYQDANSIVATAEAYTDNNAYAKISGITITANGIDISGSQYVKIASGGYLSALTGDFGIDTSQSGVCLWAGAANSANANFKVKKNGEVTLTKLLVLNESGTESEVNLRTAGLWKLNYHTVKSTSSSGGYCTSMTLSNGTTLNFNRAVPVTLSGAWSGYAYVVTATNGETNSSGELKLMKVPNGSATPDTSVTVRAYTDAAGAVRDAAIDASNVYELGQKSITANISNFVAGTATVKLDEPNGNTYYVYIPSEATNYTITHPAAHAVTISFRVGGRYFSHSFTGLSYVS